MWRSTPAARLASYTHAAAERGADWVEAVGQRKELGGTQAADVFVKTCGAKATEIGKASSVAVLVIDFCSCKSCWSPLQSSTAWLLLVALALLCSYPSVYVSALPVSGWDETEVGPLCIAPKSWRCWLFNPFSLYLREKLFFAGEFPLGTEQCWPGGWDDVGKVKLFFLLFLYSYSQVFCSTLVEVP